MAFKIVSDRTCFLSDKFLYLVSQMHTGEVFITFNFIVGSNSASIGTQFLSDLCDIILLDIFGLNCTGSRFQQLMMTFIGLNLSTRPI